MVYLFNNAASHSDYTRIEIKNRMVNKWTGKDTEESCRALSKNQSAVKPLQEDFRTK